MGLRQLRAAIRQVRHAGFLAACFQNVVQAAELERRQINSVGIAWTILYRARDPDHLFYARVIRIDLGVGQGPIDIVTIEGGRLEVDIAKAS